MLDPYMGALALLVVLLLGFAEEYHGVARVKRRVIRVRNRPRRTYLQRF